MRVEPRELHLRHLAIGKVQIGKDHVFDVGLQIALAAGANGVWLLAEQVQDDRDVVWCQAPQGVFVAADNAQVDALGVQIIQVA